MLQIKNFISDECGPCTVYYPNDTVDFENINLEVIRSGRY